MRAETMRIQKHNQQPAATCVGVRRTHSSALALGDMSVQAVNAPRMLPGARPALAVQVHSWQGAAHAHGGRAARDAAAAGVRSGRARAGRRGRRSGRGRHRRRGWRGRPVGAAARQPTSGLSFANITKLGYAATGPAMGTSRPARPRRARGAPAPRPRGRRRPPAVAAPAAWGAGGRANVRSVPGSSPADAGALVRTCLLTSCRRPWPRTRRLRRPAAPRTTAAAARRRSERAASRRCCFARRSAATEAPAAGGPGRLGVAGACVYMRALVLDAYKGLRRG